MDNKKVKKELSGLLGYQMDSKLDRKLLFGVFGLESDRIENQSHNLAEASVVSIAASTMDFVEDYVEQPR